MTTIYDRESPEQRAKRLAKMREYARRPENIERAKRLRRERIALLTSEEREEIRRINQIKYQIFIENETPEELAKRREVNNERSRRSRAKRIANETPEERAERLARYRAYRKKWQKRVDAKKQGSGDQ